MIRKKTLITLSSGLLGATLAACASAEPRAGMPFENLDANSDGVVSLEEFVDKAPSGRRDPEDIFRRVDADGDGHVSQQELDAMPKRRQGRR